MCRVTAQKKRRKKIKIVPRKICLVFGCPPERLSTGMPEVFENESSFVYPKIVIGDVRAAIGTNVLRFYPQFNQNKDI